jgi:amino acid adenylation domain-containing protein
MARMGIASDSGDVAGIVTTAWTAALALEGGDRGGSFLSQGGDSLRAMDLRARLLEGLGYAPDLAELLSCAGLAQLTESVRRQSRTRPVASFPVPAEAGSPDGKAGFSFAQERLAFMHELAGATAAYHIAQANRLLGTLQPDRLREAYLAVCRQHPELRRAATLDDGRLRQAPRSALSPEWRELDWPVSDAALEDPIELPALQDWLCEFSNAPIDLERGPLLRAVLIRLSAQDSLLLLVAHHAVLDQWAMENLLEDIAAAYRCLCRGEPVAAPPAADFAAYTNGHRQWFERERRDVELQYWTQRLHALEPTSLPEDYARPAQQSFQGARERIDLHLRDIAALRRFGATQGASLAMVMLAALKLLLARYAATHDIVVGMPVAGRHHPHARRQVGTLLNTLVIRSNIDPARGLQHALAEVRGAVLEALAHQDAPFDQVVQALRLPRDPSRPALFGVMFNMLNTPFAGMDLPDIEWSRVEFDKRSAQFDLQVTVDADHSRTVMFEYATDLYSRDSIARFAAQYHALLKDMASGALGPVNLIDAMDPEELRSIRERSQGVRIGRTSGTIPDMLAPTFERAGPSVALRCGDEILTYSQLRGAVQQLAAALRQRGVGRGALVGLCVDRSPRLVIGLLAVLEVGAAYVPLDPGYPPERLGYMAQDAAIALLLHDGQLPAGVAWPTLSCGTLDIAAATAGAAAPSAAPLADTTAPRPMDPAYVIYTSGSTGRPKGVVVQHFAVVNFLRSMAREPGLTANDRLLAITTLSFDIAVLELLLPLFIGAKIVLATTAEQNDGEQLQQLLARRRISVMQATPSTWRMLIDSGWRGTPELRALVGGEALPRELAIGLIGRCSEVWNMYGPTEATVWATCHRVEAVGAGRIPIGRPIANAQVLVLDDAGNLCPIGVPGEIHLGGDCLALGYLGQPELTAQRFIPNRYSRDRRAGRLYRTGDRGRLRDDGLIEHLGRCDSQLKIRGHRIEPGEIESRLREIAGISDAAVLGIELRPGDVRLTAYAVRAAAGPDAASIRASLRAWLPDYMLPQHIMFVAAIPLTPNGKVNRSALPRPSSADTQGSLRVAPRDRAERVLWEAWRDTIGVDAFGVTDNFFEIGGHSLLAVQLVNRIRNQLGVQCSLATLFRHPTVEALRLALQSPIAESAGALVPLNAAQGVPNLFCLCGVSLYQALADKLDGHARVLGLHVPSELIMLRPDETIHGEEPSVERLATEYIRLIRNQQSRGPYGLCGFSFGGVVAFEVARQLLAAGERVSRLWILDSDAPGTPRSAGLAALRAGARTAARWLKGAPTGPQVRYLEVMQRYQPARSQARLTLVQSREPPTYDSGATWPELAADVVVLRVDTDHLGVLSETGVTQWIDAALSSDA